MIIRGANAAGMDDFLAHAPGLYQTQSQTGQTRFAPFFRMAGRMTARGGVGCWLRNWFAIGRFTRGQAWLLAFWWDCRRNYRASIPSGEGATYVTRRFVRIFDALTDNPIGYLLATVVGVWIYLGLWVRAEVCDFTRIDSKNTRDG